jgi:UDP-N-acetyl-D-mannosaminuronate dehydrogenase
MHASLGASTIYQPPKREIFSIFVRGEIILTDATTAEMVQLMENTFRDVNIAIANEFSRLAANGRRYLEAIQYANRHPRVNILKPVQGSVGIVSVSIPGSWLKPRVISHRLSTPPVW